MRRTAFLIASLICLAVTTAHARDYKVGSLDIADPWSRATPKGASVAAGYMKIINAGTAPDRLISGSSDVAPEKTPLSWRPHQGDTRVREGGLGRR